MQLCIKRNLYAACVSVYLLLTCAFYFASQFFAFDVKNRLVYFYKCDKQKMEMFEFFMQKSSIMHPLVKPIILIGLNTSKLCNRFSTTIKKTIAQPMSSVSGKII